MMLVLATLLELWAVDRRTLWLDEVATVSSSTRSWESLGALTNHIDFVHRGYYSLLHIWFELVGYSPFALRAVSAIAIGCTAALLVVIGQRLLDLATGVLAAVAFLAMPSVSLAAANGRSQALEMLCAALASLLLILVLEAARSTRPRPIAVGVLWVAYVVVSFAGITLQLWFVFIVIGHAITVLVSVLSRRRRRWRVALPAAAAFALTGIVTVPFALRAMQQTAQIGWLKAPTLAEAAVMLFRDQAFTEGLVQRDFGWLTALATFSWCVAAIGIIWAAVRRPGVLALAVPWQFLPPIGLFTVTVLLTPTFTDRYIAMCCPALALLIATGLRAFLHRWIAILGGVLLLPILVGGVYGWNLARTGIPVTTDYGRVARMISDAREVNPQQRQALAFGALQRPGAQLPIGYPSSLRGVDDLTYGQVRVPDDYFWPNGRSQGDAAAAAGPYQLLWYVGTEGASSDQFAQAIGSGFTLREKTSLGGGTFLFRFDRTG
ncbi:hypothetical protein NS330_14265 [Curtobacterium citreum]|nr:hypothetical protein NS330_14265 [Curtobacterium citreum]